MAGSDHFYGRKNSGITVKFCGCLNLQELFRKKEREDENMSETSVNQRKVAMIGFVMLAGIIVNNGIVMVDFINQLRRGGMEKKMPLSNPEKQGFVRFL